MKKSYIDFNSLSLSTYLLRMITASSDKEIAVGTGFVYEFREELFLITNGHNITGVNHEQKVRISNSAAFPVKIRSKARSIASDHPDKLTMKSLLSLDGISIQNTVMELMWLLYQLKRNQTFLIRF
jgi:hypothetical protein